MSDEVTQFHAGRFGNIVFTTIDNPRHQLYVINPKSSVYRLASPAIELVSYPDGDPPFEQYFPQLMLSSYRIPSNNPMVSFGWALVLPQEGGEVLRKRRYLLNEELSSGAWVVYVLPGSWELILLLLDELARVTEANGPCN